MKITVVYGVPPESRKATMWHDGFTAAVDVLARSHDTQWVNALASTPHALEDAVRWSDVVLVKSSFGGVPDVWSRPVLRRFPEVPVGLMISGSGPPRAGDLSRFDVLFHETDWYRTFITHHPNVVHAFGVDTRVMRPRPDIVRTIDWLMVGQPASYKNPDELLVRTGRRVLVGDLTDIPEHTIRALGAGGVELVDFVSYTRLAELYASARTVIVACTLHGGGERSVLESRACDTAVQVVGDNPKLMELVTSQIFDHEYFARQLETGLVLARDQPLPRLRKIAAHMQREVAQSRVSRLANRVQRVLTRGGGRTGPRP